MPGEKLPEGTDQIVTGASADTGVAPIRTDPDEDGAGFDSAVDKRAEHGGAQFDAGNETGGNRGSNDTGGTHKPAPALAGADEDTAPDIASPRAGAADWTGKATDRARDYAVSGKERAVDGLDNVSRLIADNAAKLDDAVGAKYGDYARQAADVVAGYATRLREKDVDELFADAREVVRKSPGIAIGAAAALGFVVSRFVKAGIDSAAAAKEEAEAEARRASRKRA